MPIRNDFTNSSPTLDDHAAHHNEMATALNNISGFDFRYAMAVPFWKTGLWYDSRVINNSTTTGGVAATRAHAFPLVVPRVVSVDRIACSITTAQPSSVGRLGIYSSSPTTLGPDARLSDSGSFDTSTTGVKEVTISFTFSAPGLYYLVAWFSHSVSTVVASTSASRAVAGSNPFGSGLAPAGTLIMDGAYTSGLPANFATNPGAQQTGPLVSVRCA